MARLLAPRSLLRLAPFALLALPAHAWGQCTLTYQGGPVVSSLRVVQVEWGTNPVSYADQLPAFYGAVLNSPYMDLMVQYDTSGQQITRGAFVGRFTITPSVTASTVDDAQVQAELAAQIAAGHLPAPQYDAQGHATTVYMIEFPSSVTITLQGGASCQVFCSYHSSFTSGGKLVLYGVHPDVGAGGCAGGCGTGTPFENATTVHSHNIAEVVTDPDVGNNDLGWYSNGVSCGEIGDICNQKTASLVGYTVQKEWSNKDSACVAQASTPVPICDGTNAASCRPCVAADAGQASGCTGAKSSCDLSASSATYGQCIAPPAAPSHGGGGGGCASGGDPALAGLLLAGLALLRARRRA
jgi:MYXO-CTERM domain-containing protein